jgi:hypothetical protein
MNVGSASHISQPPTSHSRSALSDRSLLPRISISNHQYYYHRHHQSSRNSLLVTHHPITAYPSPEKPLLQACTSARKLSGSPARSPAAMSDNIIVGSNSNPTNPTPLSAPQEQQVKDLYYKNVRAKCAEEIETFAQCALGRTFTMIYACRQPRLAMNSCMLQYASLNPTSDCKIDQ